jgi:hypothetical protein
MPVKLQDGASLRLILHSAYSYVRSTEMNSIQGMLTLDHLIDYQIQMLKPDSGRNIYDAKGYMVQQRISRWDRLQQLVDDMDDVVNAVARAGTDPVKLREIGIYEAGDLDYLDTSGDSGTNKT